MRQINRVLIQAFLYIIFLLYPIFSINAQTFIRSENPETQKFERHLLSQVKANPSNSDCYFDLGLFYKHQHMPEASLEYFVQALTLNPKDGEAHFNAGLYYRRMNHLLIAKNHLTLAVELSPSYSAWYELGCLYADLAENTSAINCLDKAVTHCNPNNPEEQSLQNHAQYYAATLEIGTKNFQKRLTKLKNQSPQTLETQSLITHLKHLNSLSQ